MTYYPFTHEDQCLKCGGLPKGHADIGMKMAMFTTLYTACTCDWKTAVFDPGPDPGLDDVVYPLKKRRGKSTGRPPLARQILSEAVLRVAWRAVWRGSRGSCWAIAKRLEDGTYRPELVGTHELAVALDIDGVHYLVLWRKKP